MPEEQAVVPEPVVTPEPVSEDLVARVSKVKPPEVAKQEIDEKFNINDLDAQIEKLPDPVLKEQVLGLKKSLLKGENQKYQEIANLRKQYEQELAKTNTWTPEKVNGLLQNQDFVKAAQSIVGNPSQESTSMLSEQERSQIELNNQRVNMLMQQNERLLQVQQDSQLKQRYANYDAHVVDQTFNDMLQGKVQATREHLWKVIDYENAVQRAYDLGLQDRNIQNQERAKGMTTMTGMNMPQPTGVERQKGESNQQFMLRSYQKHAQQK